MPKSVISSEICHTYCANALVNTFGLFYPGSINNNHVPFSLKIVNGPTIGIILRAIVTVPNMTVSTNSLDFGMVQCGHCKVMTIQLFNDQHVRYELNDSSVIKFLTVKYQ